MLLKSVLTRQTGERIVLVDDKENYIIPTSFFTAWQSFIRDPVHINRPVLTNERFLCAHRKTNIDFTYNTNLDSSTLYALLPTEFYRLQSM